MLCAVPLQAGRHCTHQGEAVGDSALPPLHLQVLPAQPHLDSGNKACVAKHVVTSGLGLYWKYLPGTSAWLEF